MIESNCGPYSSTQTTKLRLILPPPQLLQRPCALRLPQWPPETASKALERCLPCGLWKWFCTRTRWIQIISKQPLWILLVWDLQVCLVLLSLMVRGKWLEEWERRFVGLRMPGFMWAIPCSASPFGRSPSFGGTCPCPPKTLSTRCLPLHHHK